MRSRPVWFILILAVLLLLVVLAAPFLYLSGSRDFEQLVIPADGYEIVGYLSEGTNPDGPWFVFAHGNRAIGQAHPLYQRFLRNLHPEVTILAIDLRGFGQSSADGLAGADRVWDRSGDFEAAVAYLKATHQATDDRIILSGHSLGAAQALKAAQHTPYRLVIPIGLGDYDVVLVNEDTIADYSRKLSANTGAEVNPEVISLEGEKLRPAGLFSPCPQTPVVLLFGARDDGNSVMYSPHKVPDNCQPPVSWRSVPLADHMYGTEGREWPRLVQRYYSRISISLLTYTINQLLAEP